RSQLNVAIVRSRLPEEGVVWKLLLQFLLVWLSLCIVNTWPHPPFMHAARSSSPFPTRPFPSLSSPSSLHISCYISAAAADGALSELQQPSPPLPRIFNSPSPSPPSPGKLAMDRQMSMEAESSAAAGIIARLTSSGLLKTQGLIGGKWTDAYDGKSLQVLNPATGDVVASVPCMGQKETTDAISSAYDTFYCT
ncbi:hypothetical protein ACLOJK_029894, partial [Asimina triloba]